MFIIGCQIIKSAEGTKPEEMTKLLEEKITAIEERIKEIQSQIDE